MIGLIADAFSSNTSASAPKPLGIKYIVQSGVEDQVIGPRKAIQTVLLQDLWSGRKIIQRT
ncbi:hypothetical protein D0C28_25055 [Rhizobium sp. AU243]|nr:hypothetical protein D0C28_25055 [Rhizobium sp. AU243]